MNLPDPYQDTTQKQLQKTLKTAKDKPVLIYFYEPDSNLCRLLNPKISKLSNQYKDKFHFLGLNVNKNKDLSYELNVMRCPSFILYRGGMEIRRMFNAEYDDDFQNEFRDFLVGDFLFDDSPFQRLDSMNITSRLDMGFQLNIVCFLNPLDAENWALEPKLRQLKNQHQNSLVVSLINARKNDSLLKQHGIEEIPTVTAFKEGSLRETWGPDTLPEDCLKDIKRMIS